VPESDPRAPDRITVSVVQHRLTAIVAEMGEAMLRTAYSQVRNSIRDFSTALCDADGRLLAQAEHVPIHVGALPWSVRSVLEFFRGRIRPGDLYLVNDPYHGGSHLPDVNVVRPAFHDGRLLGYACLRAHWPDVGSATPGSYGAVTELSGEVAPVLGQALLGARQPDLEQAGAEGTLACNKGGPTGGAGGGTRSQTSPTHSPTPVAVRTATGLR